MAEMDDKRDWRKMMLDKAKEDAGVLAVGLGIIASVLGAGERLGTIIATQNQQSAQIDSIQKVLSNHGAKLDTDNEILNILCFQFRCHAGDPPRTMPSNEPGTAQNDSLKPRSQVVPQNVVVADKTPTKPISDSNRSSW